MNIAREWDIYAGKMANEAQHTGERPVNSNFINFLPWVLAFIQTIFECMYADCDGRFCYVGWLFFFSTGFCIHIVSNMSCVVYWMKHRLSEKEKVKVPFESAKFTKNKLRRWRWKRRRWKRRRRRRRRSYKNTWKWGKDYQPTKLQVVKCHYIILQKHIICMKYLLVNGDCANRVMN